MKKYLVVLCAAMLCVCCLALAACGGSSSSSAAASGSDSAASASASESASAASASASESASASAAASSASASAAASSASASASSAAAQASFAGDWKFAAMIYQGVTMCGDLSAIVGEDIDITLSIKDGGTGTMVYQGESADFTWVQKDASTLTITPTENNDESLDVTLKDGALFMTAPIEGVENAEVIFTADGKYAGAKEIDVASATPVKSADELVGTWTLCGMHMMGISMYGDPADLAALAGDTDVTATFTKDGKVTMMGEEMSYAADADGVSIAEGDYKIPVKSLDGNIVVDLGDLIGMDMAMVFSK